MDHSTNDTRSGNNTNERELDNQRRVQPREVCRMKALSEMTKEVKATYMTELREHVANVMAPDCVFEIIVVDDEGNCYHIGTCKKEFVPKLLRETATQMEEVQNDKG